MVYCRSVGLAGVGERPHGSEEGGRVSCVSVSLVRGGGKIWVGGGVFREGGVGRENGGIGGT